MHIEDIVRQDEMVVEVKQKPIVSTVILIAATALACLSFNLQQNENMSFAMMFCSITIALFGLKGIIWPKKYYLHKPSNELIQRKEFYYDTQDLSSVQKCLDTVNPEHAVKMLESLPQNGATGLRVIVFATKSGSYHKCQIQKYIPYEYIPL